MREERFASPPRNRLRQARQHETSRGALLLGRASVSRLLRLQLLVRLDLLLHLNATSFELLSTALMSGGGRGSQGAVHDGCDVARH